jgi:hypothetical protein
MMVKRRGIFMITVVNSYMFYLFGADVGVLGFDLFAA